MSQLRTRVKNLLSKVSVLLLIPMRAGLFSSNSGDHATYCPNWDNLSRKGTLRTIPGR